MSRLPASLSLDLDNLWAYKMARGEPDWQKFDSYLDLAIPRILDSLHQLDLTATFFVVGQDAALEENYRALREIVAAGHEIASHSYSHDPHFGDYGTEQLLSEITRAESAIEQATGVSPSGWRSPAFGSPRQLPAILHECGYQYDASSFPTFLGPIARLYYIFAAGLDKEQKKKRAGLYGGWGSGFKPLKPHRIQLDSGQSLLEIPITVMPFFRTPIHASYLQYLAGYSERTARFYFALALKLCSLGRVAPSFLLHPTDFLGVDDVEELAWFPAMDQKGDVKMKRMLHFLGMLKNRHEILPMQDFIRSSACN